MLTEVRFTDEDIIEEDKVELALEQINGIGSLFVGATTFGDRNVT